MKCVNMQRKELEGSVEIGKPVSQCPPVVVHSRSDVIGVDGPSNTGFLAGLTGFFLNWIFLLVLVPKFHMPFMTPKYSWSLSCSRLCGTSTTTHTNRWRGETCRVPLDVDVGGLQCYCIVPWYVGRSWGRKSPVAKRLDSTFEEKGKHLNIGYYHLVFFALAAGSERRIRGSVSRFEGV